MLRADLRWALGCEFHLMHPDSVDQGGTFHHESQRDQHQ